MHHEKAQHLSQLWEFLWLVDVMAVELKVSMVLVANRRCQTLIHTTGFCTRLGTETLDSVHSCYEKKNRGVFLGHSFGQEKKLCVCVLTRTGSLISPRQPPSSRLNRKCLDLEQQKAGRNLRVGERARAHPPMQTSLTVYLYGNPSRCEPPTPRIYTCRYLQRCF